MWIFIFFIALFLLGWILNIIDERKEAKKQLVLAQIAKEVVGDFDAKKEKDLLLQKARSFSPAANKCPQCSGVLVSRKGVNGTFLGCSRYPMCRYTR